jgi:hypothetical protein
VLLSACALVVTSTFYPPTDYAAQNVKLKVAFQPDKPGARTTIKLGFRINGPNGAPPEALTNLELRMPEPGRLSAVEIASLLWWARASTQHRPHPPRTPYPRDASSETSSTVPER